MAAMKMALANENEITKSGMACSATANKRACEKNGGDGVAYGSAWPSASGSGRKMAKR
jgi:hypothetical protein